MKKAILVMTIGLVVLGLAWILTSRYAETTASAHDPGEDETSVALGKGKVTIQDRKSVV